MSKTFGIVLSCYEKVDDLQANLDILKFNEREPKIIVVYMHPDKPPKLPRNVDMIHVNSPGFAAGTLISLTVAMRHAAKLGLDYLVYRNADDWLFNHDLANGWIDQMAETGKLAAGYNWFGVGSFDEFSMNENIFSVKHFIESVDLAERRFLTVSKFTSCEMSISWWVKRTLADLENQFLRLPDREQEPGVGYELAQLEAAWKQKFKEQVPVDHWQRLADNQRFFSRKWQMIGAHDNTSRHYFYKQIRDHIPYAVELEKCRQFSRWLRAVQYGLQWNKPGMNHSRYGHLNRTKKVRTEKNMPRLVIYPKVSSDE